MKGFLLGLAYSTQRGMRATTPLWAMRIGTVPVEMEIPELGFAIEIGEIDLTECETVNQFKGSRQAAQFTQAPARPLARPSARPLPWRLSLTRCAGRRLGEEDQGAPAQDAEFVLSHCTTIFRRPVSGAYQAAPLRRFPGRLELVRRLRSGALEQVVANDSFSRRPAPSSPPPQSPPRDRNGSCGSPEPPELPTSLATIASNCRARKQL